MPTTLPNPPATLRIAILGAGKIGSTFALQLARTGGHDVTVVARPSSTRLQQLQRAGGIISVSGDQAGVRVSDSLDEQTPYDLIIVTLLAYQVDAVLPALQQSAAKCILFMFNNFEPERLLNAVGAKRCTFGMPFLQANFDQDGKLRATIGASGQKTLLGEQRWVDVFNGAGLPATLEPNMTLWLRCHVPFCVAFEGISVAGQRRGGGASWGEAKLLALGFHECFALIKALGYSIYPRSKARVNACPTWVIAAMLWVMSRIRSFRELLATGENECRALVDVMTAAAAQAKPPIARSRIESMKPS